MYLRACEDLLEVIEQDAGHCLACGKPVQRAVLGVGITDRFETVRHVDNTLCGTAYHCAIREEVGR